MTRFLINGHLLIAGHIPAGGHIDIWAAALWVVDRDGVEMLGIPHGGSLVAEIGPCKTPRLCGHAHGSVLTASMPSQAEIDALLRGDLARTDPERYREVLPWSRSILLSEEEAAEWL